MGGEKSEVKSEVKQVPSLAGTSSILTRRCACLRLVSRLMKYDYHTPQDLGMARRGHVDAFSIPALVQMGHFFDALCNIHFTYANL